MCAAAPRWSLVAHLEGRIAAVLVLELHHRPARFASVPLLEPRFYGGLHDDHRLHADFSGTNRMGASHLWQTLSSTSGGTYQ
jgi:hypothetical protein